MNHFVLASVIALIALCFVLAMLSMLEPRETQLARLAPCSAAPLLEPDDFTFDLRSTIEP